ncbi:hypothetical protein [Lichenifustis flavocetrariae]|uniref:Uncharacterized protein n=1 Tax=Lichenifustis flavocetrariae TaxID=2949735 RepID=A0AA41Z7U5_9HYPH|nr:hypothetical protein [Lichenifustis flavocetrariae]MCW6512098.1 hypothetical protein [Lichenifustis flavocetrariae]
MDASVEYEPNLTAELSASPAWLSDLHDLLVDLIRTALAPEAPEHRAWESRVLVTQARLSRGGPIPSLDQARLDALLDVGLAPKPKSLHRRSCFSSMQV